jgi:hypothetical protein
VAEVVRLPIGMTTPQDAADAFLDQHDPPAPTDASTGPPLPAWSLASAFRVAALAFANPPPSLAGGSCSQLSSGWSPPQGSAPSGLL